MNTDLKLLLCPFCGGEAVIKEISDAMGGVRKSAGCNTEDCMGYQSTLTFSTCREAAAAWNTRKKTKTRPTAYGALGATNQG